MEGVAGPVRHVVEELVVLHDNVRSFFLVLCIITEIWVLNVDRATCCSNILREDIVDEDDRFLITFDVERRHSFDVIDDYSVIEVRVWVNYVLEEIA